MIAKVLTLLALLPLFLSTGGESNAPTKVYSCSTYTLPTYPEYSEFEEIAKSNSVHTVLDCPDGYVTEYCEISKHSYKSTSDLYLYKTTAHFVSGYTANIKGEKRPNGEKYSNSYLSFGYLHVAVYQYKGLEYGGEIRYLDISPTGSKAYTVTHENGSMETFLDTKLIISASYMENYSNKYLEAAWSCSRANDISQGELVGDYTLTTYLLFEMSNSYSCTNRDAFRSYVNYSFTGMQRKQKMFTSVFENCKAYTSQGGRDYFI